MKLHLKALIGIVIAMAAAGSAAAQGSLGVYAGTNFNSMKWDHEQIHSGYRAGYSVGVAVEYIVPQIYIGFDGAVGFTGRYYDYTTDELIPEFPAGPGKTDTFNYAFMDVPIHLKVMMPYIPNMEDKVVPFIFGGPAMSFMINRHHRVTEAAVYKSFSLDWEAGIGVRLFKHLQVSACYRKSLKDNIKTLVAVNNDITDIRASSNSWNLALTWFF